MSDINYRVFFNNKLVSQEQLDRIEDITIEQEVDMVWEARITMPLLVDENGNWTKEDKNLIEPFFPVRVEIKNGSNTYVPLIDGPIVGFDSRMHTEPGKSSITSIVQDSSVYLNREEKIEFFEKKSDHEIAREIFGKFDKHIFPLDIETTPKPPGTLPSVVVQRGTGMQLLRFLARRQGMHAYVIPGDNPGKSVGCFKSFPTKNDGQPPLILLGKDRNIETFDVRYDAQLPCKVKASTLSVTDKSIKTVKSNFGNIKLMGKEATFKKEEDTSTLILPPYQGESVDLEKAVAAEATNSSYSLEVTGNVLGTFYQGVLRPYSVVSVEGVSERLRGDYLITKVTHNISRWTYSQSFSAKRNAFSAGQGNSSNSSGRIF